MVLINVKGVVVFFRSGKIVVELKETGGAARVVLRLCDIRLLMASGYIDRSNQ